jgi:hypothetical protein
LPQKHTFRVYRKITSPFRYSANNERRVCKRKWGSYFSPLP